MKILFYCRMTCTKFWGGVQLGWWYDKCKCMSFGNCTLSMSQYLMSTGGRIFLLKQSANSQTWECFSLQISNLDLTFTILCRKVIDLSALIKSPFNFWMYVPMLQTLYTNLVYPYLDYACVVWCPFQLGDVRVIEKVQSHVTKIVLSLSYR